jgi:hypothetical protein
MSKFGSRLLSGYRPVPLSTLRFAVSLRSQQMMPPRPSLVRIV